MNRPRWESRRKFLRFLAASPVLACSGLRADSSKEISEHTLQDPALRIAEQLIDSPEEALSVFDFEIVARKTLPPAHYGYLATGVDDDVTLRANREGFSKIQIRPRRLVDVRQIDMTTEFLGSSWETPIILAPAGSQNAFHPEGEIAAARAASTRRHLQILSTVSTTSVEEVTSARGAPVWYQLYPTAKWNVARELVKRAERAGCPVLVLTVDLMAGRNTETEARYKRLDDRKCEVCHTPGLAGQLRRKPMFDGIDLSGLDSLYAPALTWDFVRRLKDSTTMKLVLKGIVTREDAELCLENGADGIIVSNHGGRAEESGRATIESLTEVVEVVRDRVPVLVDGGIRRGTDIFKALALGARAVGIARPYLWGLAAFGQPGVEKVLDILRAELALTMKQMGVTSTGRIHRTSVETYFGR